LKSHDKVEIGNQGIKKTGIFVIYLKYGKCADTMTSQLNKYA